MLAQVDVAWIVPLRLGPRICRPDAHRHSRRREVASSGFLRITERDGGVVFRVNVRPGARSNEVVGEIDGTLKLRIAAPPVEGKANEECRRFLAALLKVSPSSVDIKSGAASRTKTITVRNVTAEYAQARLAPSLAAKGQRSAAGDQ